MKIFKEKMYCEPLRSNSRNKELINKFYIEREKDYEVLYEETGKIIGLCEFLKHCAWEEDKKGSLKVYVVKSYFSNDIIAYFALKAGMICLDSKERDVDAEKSAKSRGVKLVPDIIPGIEISHFAINDAYRKKHNNVKKIGSYIYPEFIYPMLKKASKLIGVGMVYLYAADNSIDGHLINYYKKVFDFVEIKDDKSDDKSNYYRPVTSYYDDNCTFMYRSLEV